MQRDLEALHGELIGLCCDDRSKPYGWYWRDGAAPLGVPLVARDGPIGLNIRHQDTATIDRRGAPDLPHDNPSFAHTRAAWIGAALTHELVHRHVIAALPRSLVSARRSRKRRRAVLARVATDPHWYPKLSY